jgi:hypothetical protein
MTAIITTDTASPTLDARARALLADGFVPGAPSAAAAEIDCQVCSDADCPGCGHHGLDYPPFFRPALRGAPSSYMALAVCRACGQVEEF